jgi:hypothetical protein
MTKGQLLAILYERLNYQSSPATDVTTRLGNHLNQAQRMILRQAGMSGLRDGINGTTFESVSGEAYYGLPQVIASIRSITDRTNDRKLHQLSFDVYREIDPGVDATGTPSHYVPLGLRACQYRPEITGLWAVSTSAADTTQVIQINGVRNSGLPSLDQTATLTGTTRVAIGTATDYTDVTTISLTTAAAGVVSIYDASSSGNVVAAIPIGHLYPQYLGVKLYPKPTAAVAYYVDGPTRIVDMDDTVDVPQLPEEYHDLLIPAAMMLEYEKTNDTRYPLAVATYREGLSNLKHHLAAGPDLSPVLGGVTVSRTSRFGSWYPAD